MDAGRLLFIVIAHSRLPMITIDLGVTRWQ